MDRSWRRNIYFFILRPVCLNEISVQNAMASYFLHPTSGCFLSSSVRPATAIAARGQASNKHRPTSNSRRGAMVTDIMITCRKIYSLLSICINFLIKLTIRPVFKILFHMFDKHDSNKISHNALISGPKIQ